MEKTAEKKSNVFTDIKVTLGDPYKRNTLLNKVKDILLLILRIAIIVGVSYVILEPVIGIVVGSIKSSWDLKNPMVYVLPHYPTLEKYKTAILRMDYFRVMGKNLLYVGGLTLLQLFVCSMVGYGFARFEFPFKKILFGCVVVTIILPSHAIMFPLYTTFALFDPFGIVSAITGTSANLLGTPIPVILMSLLGCGVKSGLYIYIFNQFFRGLPKEIEEAAMVDGAGTWYTYFRIMLVNAMPAVITVTVFSIVWQFNDTFFANLFQVSSNILISKQIATLQHVIANVDKILDPSTQQLYVDAATVLVILPVLIIYIVLQKQFVEGVERSGIVG